MMWTGRIVSIGLAVAFLVTSGATESLAGGQIYEGSWIAESFGNDKIGIGTEASQYFEALGIPQGINCHPKAPLCHIDSTPVTTTGTSLSPGNIGTAFNPLGPGCRPLTAGEKPRPAKGDTLTPSGGTCPGPEPCNKKPPLYRNVAFFTAGGSPDNQTCQASQTVLGSPANVYLGPGNPQRGIAMKGAPLTGIGIATTPGNFATVGSFSLPAAPLTAGPPGPANHMRRTTLGSFIGEGPYLYSYTYATLRNDAGSFGQGKGFFSKSAAANTIFFKQKAGGTYVQTVKVKRGSSRFGGVMKLLGSYTNKVCYFYAGGCGLGYGDWGYENIGAAGYKDSKQTPNPSSIVTASYTAQFVQTYYNTAIGTFAKYDVVEQRFPWTTGTVTVRATKRGPNKTTERRVGFDNRVGGVGTVQLVSPTLTQWLAQSAAAIKMETGGIAVMKIKFIPEPGALASLVAGVSMLWVLRRFRR
jgi:hypothetical protein